MLLVRVSLASPCFALFPSSSRHGLQPAAGPGPHFPVPQPLLLQPWLLSVSFAMSTALAPVFPAPLLTPTPCMLALPPAPLPSLVQGFLHFSETQLSPFLTHFPSDQPSVRHASSGIAENLR